MHAAALEWVTRFRTDEPVTVLDLGGRNVNGTTRDLFPNAEFLVLDFMSDDGVDIVADAGTWEPTGVWDVVTATELFEHAINWRDIVVTAFKALKPGGRFVATMAGPGRKPHSAIHGGPLEWGENYGNVHPDDLAQTLIAAGFADVEVDYRPDTFDTRCVATRP